MATKKDKTSFEAMEQNLQALINKLESGETTLEESLLAYEEAVKLIRSTQEKLQQAEQHVRLLSESDALENEGSHTEAKD